MKLNLDVKSVGSKFKKLLRSLGKYATFIFILVVLLAYSFIVIRIRTLANHEPTDDVVAERLKTLKRPKIDQATIDKIKQLQDTNVQVKALFDHARDNPFQD